MTDTTTLLTRAEADEPQAGDYWTFKLPGKRRRTKEVGRVDWMDFIVERGTFPDWKDKIERLPYVHWARANKGRYSGITVRRLMEFGRRISTKAERDAHFDAIVNRARIKAGKSPLNTAKEQPK